MLFCPPRCVNSDCSGHRRPATGQIVRWGYFTARCRERREQRFRCLKCRKTFSRQTFRHDYRDRRPDCNERLFELLSVGVGLRSSAAVLKISASTAQRKMRKMSRTCRMLYENLCRTLPPGGSYLLDEEESYEGASIRPLTVPIVIERQNYFIVATGVGSIRRLAPAGSARRAKQGREEELLGKRRDESRKSVLAVLQSLRRCTVGPLLLQTDKKASYATLAHKVFGADVTHETTAGSAPRTTHNPLFPINLTVAMSRDNCGRLRRKSWLVSKLAKWLRGQLAIFTVFRNYVRQRFRRDQPNETPAKLMGLLPRQLLPLEVLRWRQDWGNRSPHPLSCSGSRTVTTGGDVM